MKVILKSDLKDYLTEDTSYWRYWRYYISLLTVGKCYEATFTPLLYDPKTGKPFQESIIITCDDGRIKRFPLSYFITLEEYRDLQLEKILI